MSHVFISYKHEDSFIVDTLREKIEGAGLKTWMDTEIKPGNEWKKEIDHAIEHAYAVLVVLTEDAYLSPFVTYEWAYAMGLGKQVIPVLFRQTKIHPKLADKQYLTFIQRNDSIQTLTHHLKQLQNVYKVDEKYHSQEESWRYSHLQPLINNLKSEDTKIRIAAITVLGELKATATVEALIECLQYQDLDTLLAVTNSLGQIASEKAVPSLMALGSEPDLNYKLDETVHSALAQIGGPVVFSFLQKKHQQEWKSVWDNTSASSALIQAISIHGEGAFNTSLKSSLTAFVKFRISGVVSETMSHLRLLLDIEAKLKLATPADAISLHTEVGQNYEHFLLDKIDLSYCGQICKILGLEASFERASALLLNLERRFEKLFETYIYTV